MRPVPGPVGCSCQHYGRQSFVTYRHLRSWLRHDARLILVTGKMIVESDNRIKWMAMRVKLNVIIYDI